jgi:hypothetical protein
MAASALASPGTVAGPCNGPCSHRDCAETRRMADANCVICLHPIGFNRRFYILGEGPVHASCLEEQSQGDD